MTMFGDCEIGFGDEEKVERVGCFPAETEIR